MLRPVPIRLNHGQYNPSESRVSVERSGHGNLLCYETFGGRWFRSSREAVEKGIEEYKHLYSIMCDPGCLSYNDLYRCWDISATEFGEKYGYSATPEYKDCVRLNFYVTLIPAEKHFHELNEDVLLIELDETCDPYDTYLEV